MADPKEIPLKSKEPEKEKLLPNDTNGGSISSGDRPSADNTALCSSVEDHIRSSSPRNTSSNNNLPYGLDEVKISRDIPDDDWMPRVAVRLTRQKAGLFPEKGNQDTNQNKDVRHAEKTEAKVNHALKMGEFHFIKAEVTPKALIDCKTNVLLKAFKVNKKLIKLSEKRGPEQEEFERLADAVDEFATTLIDPLKSDDDTRNCHRGGLEYAVDKAIDLKQKKFIAHPVVDNLLRSKWYGSFITLRNTKWTRFGFWIFLFLQLWALIDMFVFPLLFALFYIVHWMNERSRKRKEIHICFVLALSEDAMTKEATSKDVTSKDEKGGVLSLIRETLCGVIQTYGYSRYESTRKYCVIQRGDYTKEGIKFNKNFDDEEALLEKINKIDIDEISSPLLHKDLKVALDAFENSEAASKKILVVFVNDKIASSGSSGKALEDKLNALKKKRIELIPIGIGKDARLDELKELRKWTKPESHKGKEENLKKSKVESEESLVFDDIFGEYEPPDKITKAIVQGVEGNDIYERYLEYFTTPYFIFVRDTLSNLVLLALLFDICLSPSYVAFSGLEQIIFVFFLGHIVMEVDQFVRRIDTCSSDKQTTRATADDDENTKKAVEVDQFVRRRSETCSSDGQTTRATATADDDENTKKAMEVEQFVRRRSETCSSDGQTTRATDDGEKNTKKAMEVDQIARRRSETFSSDEQTTRATADGDENTKKVMEVDQFVKRSETYKQTTCATAKDEENTKKVTWRKRFIYHFSDTWNWLDLFILITYVITFTLRMISWGVTVSVADNRLLAIAEHLYGLVTMLLTLRTFGHVIEGARGMGAIQIALVSILVDMFAIFSQFVAAILAFSLIITKVYVAEMSYVSARNDTEELACSTAGFDCWLFVTKHLAWSVIGIAELEPLHSVDGYSLDLVHILYSLFLVVGAILLVNMMIALLSNTYQRVEDNSLKEWSFKKAVTIKSYCVYHPVPVPFNLIYFTARVFYILYCRGDQTKLKYKKVQERKKKALDKLVAELERIYFATHGYSFPLTDERKVDQLLHETNGNQRMSNQIARRVFERLTSELRTGASAWESRGIEIEGCILTCKAPDLCDDVCKGIDSQRRHGARYWTHFTPEMPRIEVLIQESGESRILGVGAVYEDFNLHWMPGWRAGTVGYHADDGKIFDPESIPKAREADEAMAYRGDLMACEVDFNSEDKKHGTIPIKFFLNGREVATSTMEYIEGKRELYPYIGMGCRGIRVLARLCPREDGRKQEKEQLGTIQQRLESMDSKIEELRSLLRQAIDLKK